MSWDGGIRRKHDRAAWRQLPPAATTAPRTDQERLGQQGMLNAWFFTPPAGTPWRDYYLSAYLSIKLL